MVWKCKKSVFIETIKKWENRKKRHQEKTAKNASKKSLQKKAPLERFFYQKFFEISFFPRKKLSFLHIEKKFCKKIVLREPFFGDFFLNVVW
jgi:hypothetical protein